MAEARTIARPYAQAALEYAVEANATVAWSQMLQTLALAAQDHTAAQFIQHPQLTNEQKTEFFSGLVGEQLVDGGRNFLRLLAEYNRLLVLPEIQQIYEELLAERGQSIMAEVRVAQPITPSQSQAIAAALKQRFQREVQLAVEVDPSLMAGARIQVGDLVIDGSLRGRFARLAESLMN